MSHLHCRHRRLTRPQQAPIKSIYYWGWNTNDDVDTLTHILNLKMADGRPQITNLHIFMDFPKNLDDIDPNNPVQALTVCPGSRQWTDTRSNTVRYVECTSAACAPHASTCDVYGTMDDQVNAPVDPKDPSKGIKLNVYGPLLQQMRQQGTSIILSMLGGHGQLGPRTPMSAQGTQQLAQYLINFITKMNWDGIDFDDEYYRYAAGDADYGPWGNGSKGDASNMIALYKALYDIGHPLGYTFSLPYYSPHRDLFPNINPYIDYAMDMMYSGNQSGPAGFDLPVSKYTFGVGVDNAKGTGSKYAALCHPTDSNRTNWPQGVMTFGGPWKKAEPVIQEVSSGLFGASRRR